MTHRQYMLVGSIHCSFGLVMEVNKYNYMLSCISKVSFRQFPPMFFYNFSSLVPEASDYNPEYVLVQWSHCRLGPIYLGTGTLQCWSPEGPSRTFGWVSVSACLEELRKRKFYYVRENMLKMINDVKCTRND